MIAVAGVALQYSSACALLLLGLVWAFLLWRIKYEELVLFQSFSEYRAYMARTARLVPGVY
jgi:protein-S-isoprenylcysteine O-methyltransferase Ste14